MEELTKHCPFCGQVINAAAIKCKYCGKWLEDPQPENQQGQAQYAQQPPQQQYYVEEPRKTNGLGIAGFILSLLGILLGWIPLLGWLIWLLGLIFSFIGVFRIPRGLAIAGLVLSLLGLLIIVLITGGFIAGVKEGLANMHM